MKKDASNLGRYHLLAPLGQGGMADVHLARMRGPAGFDKLVVIKQIRRELADDPEVLRMFLDEARIAARLSHANVVQTYEVGQDGDRYFIAMEFLDGQPLSRVRGRLQERGGLPLAMHLRVLIDVLAGLHHAHELRDYDGTALGVVHRDATPQNVFITYDGAVKIVDFGIAKAKCSTVETRAGISKGKATYVPREQALGHAVTRQADIFAVGVMLWEAVAGKRPWTGVDPNTMLRSLVAGRFPSLRAASPDVPPELEAIITKALSPIPAGRHATAAELQAELESYLERGGDHTRARDLGRLVREHFTAERDGVLALIEEQMRAGPAVKIVEPAAAPQVEERCTVPEPAVTRSRTGTYLQIELPGSLSAIESPVPEVPRPRRSRALWALGLLAFAALMAGVVRNLPVPSLQPDSKAGAAAASEPAPAPVEAGLVVTAAPPSAAPVLPSAPPASALPAPPHAPVRRWHPMDQRNPYTPR